VAPGPPVWPSAASIGQYAWVVGTPETESPPPTTWSDPDAVDRYLARIGGLPPRAAGEEVLVSILPDAPRSVLDLGCGDGRLAALILEHRPGVEHVVAVDSSTAMLRHAHRRFSGEKRVSIREWDLDDPLTPLGSFDVVVAGFSIHHVEDQRKRALFGEIAQQLTDGGVFANLEVVASATPELHRRFLDLIGRPDDDPEDRLCSVEDQLQWMRHAGLTHVDCLWRWRGFALLTGCSRSI
jgi:tRNA (cmo5U34)-methyltransferase